MWGLSFMYLVFPYVCVKFRYFLLLNGFMSIRLLEQPEELQDRGKFLPPPHYLISEGVDDSI